MLKQELRTQYLAKRKSLSSQFVKLESLKISDIVTQNFNLEGKTVHLFLPISKNNEIDTWLLVDRVLETGKVVIPKANFATQSMQHFYFEKNTKLEMNAYQILEPVGAKLCDVNNIDVVLIPMLIFDKLGNRVGYGGGFYDRFIAELPQKTKLIGLSLFQPVEEIKDLNIFDKKMHACITPQEIYYFDK